jgi:hypothetical protein
MGQGAIVSDEVLEFATRYRAIWLREISLLVSGAKKTIEERDGVTLDTTMETLRERLAGVAELDELMLQTSAGCVDDRSERR